MKCLTPQLGSFPKAVWLNIFVLAVLKIIIMKCAHPMWRLLFLAIVSMVSVCSLSSRATYLQKMVQRKKIEVDTLLRKHQEADDPLVMRMTYMASECRYNVSTAIRRPGAGKEGFHTMSVLVDMKRYSPTVPSKRNIVEFESAGKFAKLLALTGVDAFLVNTDMDEYGNHQKVSRPTIFS